ncbi:MAG: hypothetical protein KAQ68_10865 [Clostridiales bacterium]|nr:hypothetical protein [Clostridiales bacterium]
MMLKKIKLDIKLIFREPIMAIIFVLPIFIILLFKFGIPQLNSILINNLDFDLSPYYIYFTTLTIILSPYMMGILTGFLMVDEKDQDLYSFIQITPSGMKKYYVTRLFLPTALSLVYCAMACLFVMLNDVSLQAAIYCCVFAIFQVIMITMLLSALAMDKVSTLTYAKALGLLFLPIIFDLFDSEVLHYISYFSPFYWVFVSIKMPSMQNFMIGTLVHIVWIVIAMVAYRKTNMK